MEASAPARATSPDRFVEGVHQVEGGVGAQHIDAVDKAEVEPVVEKFEINLGVRIGEGVENSALRIHAIRISAGRGRPR